MSELDMLTEYWTHYYYDKPECEFEGSTDNYEDQLASMESDMGIPPDDDFEDISHGD